MVRIRTPQHVSSAACQDEAVFFQRFAMNYIGCRFNKELSLKAAPFLSKRWNDLHRFIRQRWSSLYRLIHPEIDQLIQGAFYHEGQEHDLRASKLSNSCSFFFEQQYFFLEQRTSSSSTEFKINTVSPTAIYSWTWLFHLPNLYTALFYDNEPVSRGISIWWAI